MTKKKQGTYDQIVVDTLREIEPATIKQLGKALGYETPQNIWHMLKRLCSEELIYVDITNKPHRYTVKERVVSYD